MSSLIDAEAMIKRLQDWNRNDVRDKALYNFTMNRIIEQPIIEAVPVVHSEWKYYRKKCIAVCKNCSFERNLNENFGMAIACPNCGADMRKGGVE